MDTFKCERIGYIWAVEEEDKHILQLWALVQTPILVLVYRTATIVASDSNIIVTILSYYLPPTSAFSKMIIKP